MKRSATIDEVRAFCRSREVDLILDCITKTGAVHLHGEFDGYGDFFSIIASLVEYVELPASFTVGGMLTTSNLGATVAKWGDLSQSYPGTALLMWSADALDLTSAKGSELFVVVAEEVRFEKGADWQ